MKKLLVSIFFFLPILLTAQITKQGYNQFKWGQLKQTTKGLGNCSNKLSGSNFENCEVQTKDSLLLNQFKFIFCNLRFYKNQLSEIQFDINHKDLGSLISYLTKNYGNPVIKEKAHKALDIENHSTGYSWIIGDTNVFIINDGIKAPSICILSSISIRKNYPENTLSLEKLIFE